MSHPRLIIITGLSGSGKSTAARALEDEGFFLVDNLPVVLLPQLLEILRQKQAGTSDIAIVLDARNREFLKESAETLNRLEETGVAAEIFFLDADDEAIQRRYSETRRRHPLAQEEGVASGISLEREFLSVLRKRAATIIDTSRMTPHQLRAKVLSTILVRDEESARMSLHLQSFGYRYGIPSNSDLVFDVRFLPNPHFVPELREQTGLVPAVRDYVLAKPASREFLQHLHSMLGFLLPHYQAEGKSYLTISIGCTGGRHRSVALVEALGRELHDGEYPVRVIHRDASDKGDQ